MENRPNGKDNVQQFKPFGRLGGDVNLNRAEAATAEESNQPLEDESPVDCELEEHFFRTFAFER